MTELDLVVEKLHLEPGDILVCRDTRTMDRLTGMHSTISFPVPIVYAPNGVEKISRQDLIELLGAGDASKTT